MSLHSNVNKLITINKKGTVDFYTMFKLLFNEEDELVFMNRCIYIKHYQHKWIKLENLPEKRSGWARSHTETRLARQARRGVPWLDIISSWANEDHKKWRLSVENVCIKNDESTDKFQRRIYGVINRDLRFTALTFAVHRINRLYFASCYQQEMCYTLRFSSNITLNDVFILVVL